METKHSRVAGIFESELVGINTERRARALARGAGSGLESRAVQFSDACIARRRRPSMLPLYESWQVAAVAAKGYWPGRANESCIRDAVFNSA